MKQPLNNQTPTNVEVLCLTPSGPVMFMGRAQLDEENEIDIALTAAASDTLTGCQAILSFPADQDAPRITAKVLRTEGEHVFLSSPQLRPRDKRLYPRLYGNIPLRFQAHHPDEGELVIHRWLAGSTQDIVPRPWFIPEPFMDFSVNGLSFESPEACVEGSLLLLHMGVGESGDRWRATGRVIRTTAIPDSSPALYQVAMSFEVIPDAAMEALSDFTLSIQEALL